MSQAMDAPVDFAATVDLLWAGPKPRTRGPKPAHSLEEVLDAAIGLADREGLGAVSMQRLAEELGFTKMALYRYVPGRPELVAAMTDRGLGPPPADPGLGWRKGLEAWALAAFETFIAHPWGLEATTGPRVLGPNEADWTEAGLKLLAGLPLRGADRLDVLAVTISHMRAMAQQAAGAGSGAARGDGNEALLTAGIRLHADRFPEFARAVAETAADGGADNGLSFGLNCIFDGVALRIGEAGHATPT